MKRIRYDKFDEGLYSSTQMYEVPGVVYRVYLDSNEWKFEVVEEDNSLVAYEGTGSTLVDLKNKARKALIELGVVFEKEIRIRPVKDQAA